MRTAKTLAILSVLALAGSALGQGVVLRDTATVEIVDVQTAIAMGAPPRLARLSLDSNLFPARVSPRTRPIAVRPIRRRAAYRLSFSWESEDVPSDCDLRIPLFSLDRN